MGFTPKTAASSMDSLLLQIGCAIGILQKDPKSDSVIINTDWFQDPIKNIQSMPTKQREDLFILLDSLFGSISGTTLGAPGGDLNGTWFSIPNPATGKPSGLSLVSTAVPTVGNTPAGTLYSIGLLVPWRRGDALTVTPFLSLPLVFASESGTTSSVLGNVSQYPIRLGLVVSGGAFTSGKVGFDGLQITADLAPDGSPAIDILLLNLNIPGLPRGDLSLSRLAEQGGEAVAEWVALVLGMLAVNVGQTAGHGNPTAAALYDLLVLLGATGAVPEPAWGDLAARPAATLEAWLAAICGTPATLQAFLNTLSCLWSGTTPAPDGSDRTGNVSGTGTPADPFAVPLFSASDSLTVHLTVGVQSQPGGGLLVYPGLRAVTAPVTPVSDVAARIVCRVELLEIALAGAQPQKTTATSVFPSFDLHLDLSNPAVGTPLFQWTGHDQTSGQILTIRSARAGVGYSGSDSFAPFFALDGVSSEYGAWASVDLTNFDSTLQQILTSVVETALTNFFSAEGREELQAAGAVLGIIAPPDIDSWPTGSPLLTGPRFLPLLLHDPLTALGAYHAYCLGNRNTAGTPLFADLLPSLGTILTGSPMTAASITGSGTADSPWLVPLHAKGGLTADLAVWQVPGSDGPALTYGIRVAVPIPVSTLAPTLTFTTALIRLALPDATGAGGGAPAWLPHLSAELGITGPKTDKTPTRLSLPAVAGITLSAAQARVGCLWTGRFSWVAGLSAVQVAGNGNTVTVGDLMIGDGGAASVSGNLGDNRDTLARLTTATTGMALLVDGGRIGTLVTTALGLLPGLPDLYKTGVGADTSITLPPGVALPATWPTVTASGAMFRDPWQPIRAQLGAVFTPQSAYAGPLMRVLGWAATGTVPPARTASGTAADPWSAPLGLGPLQALLWSSGSGVGAGTAAQLNAETVGGISITVTARLDMGAMSSGQSPQPVLPALSVHCTLANANATVPLIGGQPNSALTIGNAVLGLAIGLDAVGGLTVTPSVVLNGAAVGVGATTTVTIQPGSAAAPGWSPSGVTEGAFETLLNALMRRLSTASPDSRLLMPLLDLLTDVAIAQKQDDGSHGINPGGWTGLMADPLTYLTGQGAAIAATPARSSALFAHLGALVGFEPPDGWAWKAIPDVLAAFGLMRKADGGWVPVPSAWLALLRNPVAYTQRQAESLATGDGLQPLLTRVGAEGLPTESLPLGPFTLRTAATTAGVSITLAAAVAVGGKSILDIGLSVALDATTSGPALDASLTFGIPALALDVVLAYGFADGRGAFRTTLAAAPSIPAPFPPIQIHPFDADIGRLAEQIALILLTQGVSRLLSQTILPKSPFACALVTGIGLAAPDSAGNIQITRLLPALLHPLDWLLEPQALGDGNGRLDLKRLGTLLAALPGSGVSGPGGLTVKASGTDGLALTGLPYGVGATIRSASASGIGLTLTVTPSLPASVTAALTGQLNWMPAAGLVWNGSVKVSVPAGSQSLVADITCPADGGVTVNATVPTGSTSVSLPLVPFPGFNALAQLFESQADIGALLEIIANRIATAWRNRGSGGDGLDALVVAFQKIGTDIGITSVDSLMTVLQSVKSEPLPCILSWFTGSGSRQLIADLCALLNTTLGIDGVTVTQSGMLGYSVTVKGKAHTGGADIAFGPLPSHGGTALGLSFGPHLTIAGLTVAAGASVSLPADDPEKIDAAITASLKMAIAAATNESFAPAIGLGFGLGTASGAVTSPDLRVTVEGAFETLHIDLLPDVRLGRANTPPGTPVSTEAWLAALGLQVVLPATVNTLLATPKVAAFLNAAIGATSATSGDALKNAGFLTASGKGADTTYALAKFAAMPAETFVLKLLAGGLTALVPKSGTAKILDFGSGRGTLSVAGATQDDGTVLYGVTVALAGITVGQGSPTVTLQLGNWLTGETKAQSWVTRSDPNAPAILTTPGLTVYFLEIDDGTPSFHIALDLISIGVDIEGSSEKPLLSAAGYGLEGVEARLLVSVDQDSWSSPIVGGAVRLDKLSLPLGPAVADASSSRSSSNPVAQSLLTSGHTSSGGTGDAVNPSFSAAASYVNASGGSLDLQFYDASGNPTDEVQIPIDRALGPLNCRSIGLGASARPATLSIGFTGSVDLSLLNIGLENLSVAIPLTTPQNFGDYTLHLGGMNVRAGTADVKLGGALLQQGSGDAVRYTGQFTIQTPGMSLSGIGSYAALSDGTPSLFAYVQFTPATPLGGPPFFFVTGLAGGFGFNRALTLPKPDQVVNFPLVTIAAQDTPTDIDKVLTQLGSMAPVRRGQYWLAAGVRFSSFQVVNTNAVVAVVFGNELEIALLGTSTLVLPQGSTKPYVQAILNIDVVVDVERGSINATAILAQNSYIFDPACHLSGGFAFSSWFAGPHSGDFAITLGGYHPQFTPPAWYPTVPRLAIDWSPGGGVSIRGRAYFALCPGAVMAGGSLAATYTSGALRAWLTIEANFLIRWNPFSYDITVSVGLGASLTVKVLFTVTFSVEMSASLHLWGPPFAGVAEVSWSVLSFSVDIGETGKRGGKLVPMNWDAFASAFLPQPSPSSTHSADVVSGAGPDVILCRFKAITGLMSTADGGGWVVDGESFAMGIELTAPVTTVSWLGKNVPSITGKTIGIPSMGLSNVKPQLTVTCGNADAVWAVAGVTAAAAGTLWSTLSLSKLLTPANAAATVPDCVTGITAAGAGGGFVGPSPVMSLPDALLTDALAAGTVPLPTPQVTHGKATVSATAIHTVATTVTAVAGTRSALFAAAAALTGLTIADGPLTVMAAQANILFQDEPMLGPVGSWPVGDATAAFQPAAVVATAFQPAAAAARVVQDMVRTAAPAPAALPPVPRLDAAFMPALPHHPLARGTGLIVNRRSVAAHPDELAILAALAPTTAAPARRTMSVPSGATVLWSIPDGSASAAIDLDGALPVRLVAIGTDGLPLLDRTVADNAPASVHLPDGTVQLALEAAQPDDFSDGLAGWTAETVLRQIGTRTALGPGCTIRTQGETLRRSLGRWVSTGTTTGRAWAEGCTAVDAKEQSAPGWITTCLPPGTVTVTVTLCPSSPSAQDAHQPAIPAQVWLPHPDSGPAPVLNEQQTITGPDRRVYTTYGISGLSGDTPVAVTVRPLPGWQLAGVVAGGTAPAATAPPMPALAAARATATLTIAIPAA